MEAPKKEDILLLPDEKFDCDLSLSSSSANEDDEVVFGPTGHKEKCIAASLNLNNQLPEEPPLPASERNFTWSPLTGEKFVEVYKEAHLLAFQIQSNGRTKAAQAAQSKDPGSQEVEGFIQESKLKINLFDRENEVKKSPKSLKQETYCLSDDLWRASLLRGTQPASSAAPPAAPAQTSCPETSGPLPASCPSLPAEPSAVQPPNQAGAQKKVISKLLPPQTSSFRGKSLHSAVEKPARQKPASPPRMKIQNEKDTLGSMPLDKLSTTRDVASVPASGSHLVPGKRLLCVPNKSGPKKTMLKPREPQGHGLQAKPEARGCGVDSGAAQGGPQSISSPAPDPGTGRLWAELSLWHWTFLQKRVTLLFHKVSPQKSLDEEQPPEATALSEALLVDLKLDQLSLAGEAVATALNGRPLADFYRSPEAAVALRSETGPLVDLLTNTPEANRKAVAKPPDKVGQLTDLASPLILLSPEADKENMESPLLKF
ncbi:hypothetical protein JEQ12_012285 [Ovis aries]|uniref:G2 and S phase-expressed protein 1 N-terminal domain-containing protein n=1 Tax=Ovis aries TaxID=9940 RepID=A0A836CTK7_SHEEP|nr:hypothetical protein JEQ12_012285 [Ovis aries]